ncbi:hypothetical protein PDG61_20875 [Mycolicibacterium sp. BiH015]|uniref:hypothetical protein n=1 Tax=Mycolicibacterium sp. BiH015 TaxID=3018808 RepID=UPI0022E3F615|nr:hypothetical protein [Mycolicibacterium sp. BiH015]MDA2893381.1 hypothetical protein [Mycolicibacterium sp. BiH015]
MLGRLVLFVERRWLSALVLVSVLVSVFFLAFGFTVGWGATEWGSYGQCVGSAFTLAAVVVALRESGRGHRESLKAQRSRLIDHELTRRRENLNALADLWAALMVINMAALKFRSYFDSLPRIFNANVPRSDQDDPDATNQPLAYEIGAQYETYLARWVEVVEPPLFVALSMLKGTPLYEPLRELNKMLADYKNVEIPKLNNGIFSGRRPDTTSLGDAWKAILAVRQQHLDLAQEHFSLNLADVEAAIPESPRREV